MPLHRAWGSARGGFDRRHGWLIRIGAGGLRGHGDCAPLPAAGTETREIAQETLARLQPRLLGRDPDALLGEIESEHWSAPATAYALECALADLLCRRQERTLRHWLSPDASDTVPVNAMLGALGSLTARDLQEKADQGFRVLKLKIGLAAPGQELEGLMALVSDLAQGVSLRLDANGAWGFDEARRMIAGLARLPIESIEEPLRDPTAERLTELQSLASFPLALDESLPRLGDQIDPGGLGVRRLVLKPAALGGLRRTQGLARRAMAVGIEVVITSLVESAAGLWPTAQLAAAIGSSVPQGLATADWLAQDLGSAPRPRHGRMSLPNRPGSGFEPSS
nr:o-succinylbenzoate synthase [Thiocystis violacea]